MNKFSCRLFAAAGAALAFLTLVESAQAVPCSGVSFGASFAGSYSCNDLGTPSGIPANLGGLAFLDNNTLLVGGAANGANGVIRQIGVVRDANNHIIGFSGPSTAYATAPYVDGGIAFGPGGVLFATGYPNNTLMQFKPGSTTPDKVINLSSLVGTDVGSSVGTLAFVPTGFGGAGQLKIASYSTGQWYTASLAADGLGTYDITVDLELGLTGGPEGIAYVLGNNAGFGGNNSVLVSEYSSGKVGAYQVDANGNPIVGSRVDFLTGLSGAEGAFIDPLTGDFLFSTFGGSNRLLVISGFEAPPTNGGDVPEPAALGFLGLGVLALAVGRRRKLA